MFVLIQGYPVVRMSGGAWREASVAEAAGATAEAGRQRRQVGSGGRSLTPVFQLSFFTSSSGTIDGPEATKE
jgi:hypothetical protein